MKNIIKNLIRLLINPIIIEHTDKLQKEINTIYSEIHPQIFTSKNYRLEVSKNPRKNFNSFDFCNLFRGDENFIKERHKFYLRFFSGRKNILDVGCGRGELLELLRDKKIPAQGIDSDPKMVNICKKRGLNVIRGDVIFFLEKTENNKFGGIFAAQVIEHLDFNTLLTFLNLSLKKIIADGLIIIETINPHCFPALKLFHVDPTHKNPLFPESIKFIFESIGFKNVRIIYLHPIYPKLAAVSENQSDCFNYADYAAIGYK